MINICRLYNKMDRICRKIFAWCVNEKYDEPISLKEVNIITALLEIISYCIFTGFMLIISLEIRSILKIKNMIVNIKNNPIFISRCEKQ